MTNLTRRNTRRPAVAPRRYGGLVIVTPVRDRYEPAEDRFSVAYHSIDGDIAWLSKPIGSQDQADAAANTLAEFLGASVRQ